MKYTKILLASLLVLLLLVPSVAHAQTTTLGDRIKSYQKEYSTALSKSQEQRFKLRCGVAQTVMQNLRGRIAIIQEKRTKVYGDVSEKLTTLSTKVAEKSVDTTKLNDQIKSLQQKIDEFNQELTTYKQAVEDMADMDCQANPSGFRAALLTARESHDKLVILVGDIRTYITNAIKPTLGQVKEELVKQQSTQIETEPEVNDAAQ